MIKTIRYTMISLAACLAWACTKYDSIENNYRIDYGTAYLYDGVEYGGQKYYIVRDDGVRMHIKNNLWMYGRLDDEERILFRYEILSTNRHPVPTQEKCEIKLYHVSQIECHKPVTLSFVNGNEQKRQDSLGYDPIYTINSMEYSGKYLNVIYTCLTNAKEGSKGRHTFSLLADDISGTEKEINVYFRHNAYGDIADDLNKNLRVQESEVSFDIGSLLPEGYYGIKVNFFWTVRDSSDGNEPEVETKSMIFEPAIKPHKPIIVSESSTDDINIWQ